MQIKEKLKIQDFADQRRRQGYKKMFRVELYIHVK